MLLTTTPVVMAVLAVVVTGRTLAVRLRLQGKVMMAVQVLTLQGLVIAVAVAAAQVPQVLPDFQVVMVETVRLPQFLDRH